MEFPLPLLVCDVGGTNVRFALKREDCAPLEMLPHKATGDFAGLAEAVESSLGNVGQPCSLIVCGAGPVIGRSLHLTNAAWQIDGSAVARTLRLKQGLLLNDFEAQALSLPSIPDGSVLQIGHVAPAPNGTRLILGPGTGLGVAALLQVGGTFIPVPSEAGHVEFGPIDPVEASFWPHLERVHGRVTSESVMAGSGLSRIHRARMAVLGHEPAVIENATIVSRALENPDSEEARTIAIFWRLIARFAGDMAIVFKALGGVTLAGGILPRVKDLLNEAAFRQAFERKAPMDTLARTISTRLVVEAETVLIGMAAIGISPQTFNLDYAERAWCPP